MSRLQRAIFLQYLGTALAVGLGWWILRTWPVLPLIARAQEYVGSLGWWGMALYPTLFAACNVLLLPAGTLALGSGLFFGLWRGFLVNVAGNVLGAAVAMAFSRHFGRGLDPAAFSAEAALGRSG